MDFLAVEGGVSDAGAREAREGRRTLGPDLAGFRVVWGAAVAPVGRLVFEDGVLVENIVGEVGHF